MSELELLSGYEHKLSRETNRCLDLLTNAQDIVFSWASVDKIVLAINLGNKGKGYNGKKVVCLTPSSDINFEVDCLLPNNTCSYICMWSGNGLAIMKLPQSYEKDTVCRVDFIDHLALGDHVKVRAVKWHPGSSTDTHVVVLTDDEILRCHNITGEILWICPFYKSRDKSMLPHELPDLNSLGSIAIDFDFVPPLEQDDPQTAVWSILVLYGNGDLYLIETKMEKNKYSCQGPLRMYPQSHDNYGLNASSLLVLKSSPPVVVISTCDNMLYHSLLMSDVNINKKALFVFEAINLDIGLNLLDEDEILHSPIRLKYDPIDKSRYFCTHIGGLQLITIPVVANLAKFSVQDMNSFQNSDESTIQNLLCTAVVKGNESESAPILGFTFIDLFMTVYVLQSDGKIVDIKPFITSCGSSGELIEGSTQTEDDDFFRAVECRVKEARSMKPPFLKLPKNTNPEVCTTLVARASRTLTDCMRAHQDIASMLNQKSESIRNSLDEQIQEIEFIKGKKNELKENAEAIAIRYEELCETQNSLVARADSILRQMCATDTPLSESEIGTLKKLKALQQTIKTFDEKIERLKAFYEFQSNAGGLKEVSFRNKNAFLNNVRINTLRESLSTLTEEISTTSASIEEQSQTLNDLNVV